MDENLLHDVVAAALKAGADGAEAVGAERQSLSITVRAGALEEVEREEARDLGLRVFVGKKQATVSGSDLSADARARQYLLTQMQAHFFGAGAEAAQGYVPPKT